MARGLILLLAVFLISGCASVITSTDALKYPLQPKVVVSEFDPLATPLGSVYADEILNDPLISGATLIRTGDYALFHRIALARMAEKSICLQTYIYENDITSRILMHEMKLAADRGVKVRILVDDLGLDSDHSDIMLLNYHPNIEVKVFNAFRYRARLLRYPQLVLGLARHNYRMHNKLFIVDDVSVIIGGRNVGGNYFDNSRNINFSDTDVLFIGRMATEAVESFDDYWDYHLAIPVSEFPGQDKPEALGEHDQAIVDTLLSRADVLTAYTQTVDRFISTYRNKQYQFLWGHGRIIADPPEKTEGEMKADNPMMAALGELWDESSESIYISSAYLVPGEDANENIIKSTERGLAVYMLTNSLSSTDSKVVYGGWAKYRDKLLASGVKVYEFRNEGYEVKGTMSSGASLHSKVIVFDDKVTWVGSFNFDPRSAAYNTETIAVFDCPEFARIIRESIEDDMSDDKSWEVYLDEKGNTNWRTVRGAEEIIVDHSPDTSLGMRFLMGFLSYIIPDSFL